MDGFYALQLTCLGNVELLGAFRTREGAEGSIWGQCLISLSWDDVATWWTLCRHEGLILS